MNKIYQKSFPGVKNAAKRRLGGFTLIELLVVVLIIGILAAVAVPKYQKAVKRSRAAQALIWIKNIQKAQDLYFMDHGAYATCFNDLDVDFGAFTIASESNGCVTSLKKGSGEDALTLSRAANGTFSSYIGNYGYSGAGGYAFSGIDKIPISCAEHSCHGVEEGSFCRSILGIKEPFFKNAYCIRLYKLP